MSLIEFTPPSTVGSEEEFRTFLVSLDAAFSQINTVQTSLGWAKIFSEPFDAETQAQIDAANAELYTEPNHELLKTWRSKSDDPYLQRWAEVLDNQFTMNSIDQTPELRALINHISDRYIQWRPKIDGNEISYTELTRINRLEPDRALRLKGYLSLWDLGNELDAPTKELFHRRNEAAKASGYATYADMKLALVDGVDREWLLGCFAEMESTTQSVFDSYLQAQAEKEDLPDIQPWDSQYLLDRDSWPSPQYYPADKMAEDVWKVSRSLGLDREALGISLTFYDSAAGGQCMTMAPDDIRVLTSKADGMLHYNTAFHEFGHAIHSAFYDEPHTLQRESGMFTEGIAMYMERFLHYPTWMRRSGVPEAEIEQHRLNWRLPRIYRHRRLAPMVMAELAYWDNPECDINQVFGEQTAHYLGTEYEPRSFAAITRWIRPMQLQSYFIADLIASQVHTAQREMFPAFYDSPDVIEHTRTHLLAPGNAIPWRQKIINATGKDLSYADLGVDMREPYPDA